MPTQRAEVGAAAVGDKIYVVGAYSGATTANEAYDTTTDTWQSLTGLPRPLNHVGAAGVQGKLYVIGGFSPESGNRPVDTTYVYDPATDQWGERATMPTPRGALVCVVVADVIYAIAGAGVAGDTGTLEAYDPSTDTWRADLSPMPTPREHLAGAELDGRIHVIGGRSPALGLTGTAHEVYDPASNSWTTAAALPTGRSGLGAAVLAGRIHVIGGEADHTFNENEAYDPTSDSWLTSAPVPTPRHGLGVVAVGDAIYALAGGPRPGDARSNVVEIFWSS